ncbi:hypothetical protein evm_001724 [Chilo suppressalis]|nr:hypothetical protein evm_001724 [Chilo suppressalis]
MHSFTVLIFTLLFINITNAKEIKIKIDSNDLLKIVGGFINSDNFINFADQIVQRTAMKYGTYNNPYHPEDNIVENFDEKKTAVNRNLDEENDNFISGAEDKIEDRLTEVSGAMNEKGSNDQTKTYPKIFNQQATANEKIPTEQDINLMRSSENLALMTPVHGTTFFHRSFAVQAVHLWNSLPVSIRRAETINAFKNLVKSHYLTL